MKKLELAENTSPQQVKLNFYSAKSFLDRILWHTHAMTTVFGVLFLLTSSLVFIILHWIWKDLLNLRITNNHRNIAESNASFSIIHEDFTSESGV